MLQEILDIYAEKLTNISGELQLALVLSAVAHADIKSVDTTDALAMPGVKGYISSADVPGNNEWDGELVFNDKTVGVFSFSTTIIKSFDIRVP